MWIAVIINTFHGRFEPYGLFDSEEKAWNWIEATGVGIITELELWSTFEIKSVEASNG